MLLAPGFLAGSKFMIRIFGIHPSVESNPSVLADLLFPGAGDVGDAGDEPMATRDTGRTSVRDAVKKEPAVDALTSLNRMPLRCTLNLGTLKSNQNQGFMSDGELAAEGPELCCQAEMEMAASFRPLALFRKDLEARVKVNYSGRSYAFEVKNAGLSMLQRDSGRSHNPQHGLIYV